MKTMKGTEGKQNYIQICKRGPLVLGVTGGVLPTDPEQKGNGYTVLQLRPWFRFRVANDVDSISNLMETVPSMFPEITFKKLDEKRASVVLHGDADEGISTDGLKDQEEWIEAVLDSGVAHEAMVLVCTMRESEVSEDVNTVEEIGEFIGDLVRAQVAEIWEFIESKDLKLAPPSGPTPDNVVKLH